MCRQARPHCRTRVLLRPRQHAFKAGPVCLVAQIGGARLAAGEDQSIWPSLWRLLPKLLDAKVKAVHAALSRGLSFHLGQSIEREADWYVHRSRLEQPEKLMLGCTHGGIGHIIDQADVQHSFARLFERAYLDNRPVEACLELRIGIFQVQ